MNRRTTLTQTLDLLKEGSHKKNISVSEIVEKLNSHGFGAMLVGQSSLIILPTGAIPGAPSFISLLIMMTSLQIIFGKKRLWFPKKIRDYTVTYKKLETMIDKSKPFTKKIDKVIQPRMSFVFTETTEKFIPILSLLLAMTIPVLGFIPFLADVPALGILLLGLCLCCNDGLLFFFSLMFFAVSAIILPTTLMSLI